MFFDFIELVSDSELEFVARTRKSGELEELISEANLRMARELGYTTVFWRLAYVDWYDNTQPAPDEAMNILTSRIHPGAIVLLHSTSKTNGEILDSLLTKWEEMGYTFGSLEDLKG